jgi:hypothetical protein
MNRKLSLIVPSLVLCLAACVEGESNVAPSGAAPAEEPVSQVALEIEQAERMLDRGEDAAVAKAALLAALADPELGLEERAGARLALSRAHQALGETEDAIVVVENELAAHGDDPNWSRTREYKDRLRELLTGVREQKDLDPYKKSEAVPFAHALAKYFPAAASGKVEVRLFSFGGDADVSSKLGTFEVGAALRAELEESCPLCDHNVDVHTHSSRSDWLMIPSAEGRFDDALVVFYFDLGKNRIPARYERHLPMKIAEIERELAAGKSFVVGAERDGAPPVLLLAAPRTAMLADLEAQVVKLDRVPSEPVTFGITDHLRPQEIQGVIRAAYFPQARDCYKGLLARDADAQGKIKLHFVIDLDGSISRFELKPEGTLDDEAFLGCMNEAAATLAFPASSDDTTVDYPIVLTPS